MTIRFTIPGKPVPKAKLTKRQQWMPKAQAYREWKAHVQKCLQPALIAAALDLRETDPKKLMKGERFLKPISTGDEKIRMEIAITFGDEHHPDPENIFGSIADAIFVNDKHLEGSFTFTHSKARDEKVDVKIIISENERQAGAGQGNQVRRLRPDFRVRGERAEILRRAPALGAEAVQRVPR